MKRSVYEISLLKKMMSAFVITAVLLLVLTPGMALAGSGGDDNRSEFYGVVEARPQNGWHGEWVIGGRTFMTDPGTEFDETEGLLSVGSCAKVHWRNGRVHEIDSEPKRDCQ